LPQVKVRLRSACITLICLKKYWSEGEVLESSAFQMTRGDLRILL